MTLSLCRSCGSAVLTDTPPESCNNCDPRIQAALAAVVNFSELDEVTSMTYVLLRDITAGELAMDSPTPGEGYGPDDVVWPKGTKVILVDPVAWSEGDDSIEVTEANFPNFGGYVNRGDITQTEGTA